MECISLRMKHIIGSKLTKISFSKEHYNYFLNLKLFYGLTAASIIFSLFTLFQVLYYYLSGTQLWQIRNWLLEPIGSNNPILNNRSFVESFFRTIVLSPFNTINVPITVYYFFNPKYKKYKHRKIMLVLAVVNLIVSALSNGGARLSFLCFLGYFLLGYFLFSNRNLFRNFQKMKYKKYIYIALVIGVIAVVIFTQLRAGSNQLIRQTYIYFALPPTLLSIWLPEIKAAHHTYGMLTLFGIHSYFFRFLKAINFDNLVPHIYDEAYQYILNAEKFKQVGSSVSNAFVTPIYYFFIDGGYIFVCFASFLFGVIVAYKYNTFSRRVNIYSFICYCLIMYGIFVSFMRIQTCIPVYLLSFVLARLILKKCSY